MPLAINGATEFSSFVRLLPSVIVAWILITLWLRVIDNLTYKIICARKESLLHTTIIAMVATGVLLLYMYYSKDVTAGVDDAVSDLAINRPTIE